MEGANAILKKELDSKAHAMLVERGKCERLGKEIEKNELRHEELKSLMRGNQEAFKKPLFEILTAVEVYQHAEPAQRK